MDTYKHGWIITVEMEINKVNYCTTVCWTAGHWIATAEKHFISNWISDHNSMFYDTRNYVSMLYTRLLWNT